MSLQDARAREERERRSSPLELAHELQLQLSDPSSRLMQGALTQQLDAAVPLRRVAVAPQHAHAHAQQQAAASASAAATTLGALLGRRLSPAAAAYARDRDTDEVLWEEERADAGQAQAGAAGSGGGASGETGSGAADDSAAAAVAADVRRDFVDLVQRVEELRKAEGLEDFASAFKPQPPPVRPAAGAGVLDWFPTGPAGYAKFALALLLVAGTGLLLFLRVHTGKRGEGAVDNMRDDRRGPNQFGGDDFYYRQAS